MPTPRRGTGTLQAGTVTAVSGGYCTITVAGQSYTLPYLGSVQAGDERWVLWAGRTGLVLAPAGCTYTCPFSAWASYEPVVDSEDAWIEVVNPETIGTAPYVDTNDDGSSYVRMYATAFDQTSKFALFRFPTDFDLSCFPGTLNFTFRVKFAGVPEGATVYPAFSLAYPDGDGDYPGTHVKGIAIDAYTRSTSWQTITGSCTLSAGDRSLLQTYISAGEAGLIVGWPPAVAGWSFYLSFAEISCPD